MISFGCESITEIILSHSRRNSFLFFTLFHRFYGDPDTELIRKVCNKFLYSLQLQFNSVFQCNAPILGNASIFMNKVYADWIFWFNALLPVCKNFYFFS